MNCKITDIEVLVFFFLLLYASAFAQKNPNVQRLKGNADYFCYYGSFDENTVLQCQYFDLLILDVNYISPSKVEDIRNGFDNITGTDDDVIVIGYLSIGEQDGNLVTGDGTGPIYWNGQKIIYENKGYASFYVDDKDKNGLPDKDGIWNSYYVNAGDSAWWEFNRPAVENILVIHSCDGLFLDLIDTAGPNSWGLDYEWTKEGMINYVEQLRQVYPEKYLLANRGIFYFEPSLPHYQYADRYRKSIDGLMMESYSATWDWTNSRGYANPEHTFLSQHFAPLLNNQANKEDGFNIFILDYLSSDQSDHDQLLEGVVNAAEGEQGWLVAVSSILLDEIRYDTFNHHVTDFNPPSWKNIIGIASFEWIVDSLVIYWNKALDQTPPVKYNLYVSEGEVDFNAPAQYQNIIPQESELYDCKYVVGGLDKSKTYNLALRASDSAFPDQTDPNQKITSLGSISHNNIQIDGYFEDWEGINSLVTSEAPVDTAYSQIPEVNFTNFWAANDSAKFYLCYQTAGNISSSYFYHVFIETDDELNKKGFVYQDSASIGAEFMIESNFLYKYTGSGGTNWSWIPASGMQKADNSNRTEISIPLSTLFTSNSFAQTLKLIFQVNLSDAPYAFMSIAPVNYKEQHYEYRINAYTNVKEQNVRIIDFELEQNFPNPFNSRTTIKFNLVQDGKTELKIYNSLGQLVKTVIANEYKNKGTYCYDVNMNTLCSGIYFYKLAQANQKTTKAMILIK
ncbi:MAG: T9SS C-terminal target domain-containing protein [Ignavibacteriales bacterium]|nr:MAG: T9SS C-terminal target domain-containing protein [Ignavibacteriales bacterium]